MTYHRLKVLGASNIYDNHEVRPKVGTQAPVFLR